MFPRNNMRWCRFATCFLVTTLVPAFAAASEPDLPDAAGCVDAFLKVRTWVTDYGLPDEGTPDAELAIEGATAICVLIRHSGSVVGEGQAHGDDPGTLRRAVRQALLDVHGNPRLAEVPFELRPQIGRTATVQVEVAGELEPLIGDTFEEAAAALRPGLDGFALRAGDEWLFRFPAQMRADLSRPLQTRPSFYMQTLLSEMGVRRRPLAELRANHRFSIYRFRTVDLAQASPSGSPFPTWRGERIVANRHVDANSVRAFAATLAQNLMNRKWSPASSTSGDASVDEMIEQLDDVLRERERQRLPEEQQGDPVHLPGPADVPDAPLGLRGTYLPLRDAYVPDLAMPFDQALASYALSQFAKAPGVDAEQAGRAAALAEGILYDLTQVVGDEEAGVIEFDPAEDPIASAMFIVASRELVGGRARQKIVEFASTAEARIWSMFDADARAFRPMTAEDGSEHELPPNAKALLAMAMTRLALVAPPHDGALDVARDALDAAWAAVEPVDHLSLLPWIGWGELDYALIAGETPAQDAMNELRDMLRQAQLTRANGTVSGREIEPDLLGGFLLAGPGGTAVTAQGVRPAAWLARLLQDRQEVPAENLPLELGRLMQFARFLMQLAVTADDTWAYPAPQRAAGGVCQSLWDPTQALPAQALALCVAADILKGLDRIEKMR